MQYLMWNPPWMLQVYILVKFLHSPPTFCW